MRSLYSIGYRRRSAFGTTSGSGFVGASACWWPFRFGRTVSSCDISNSPGPYCTLNLAGELSNRPLTHRGRIKPIYAICEDLPSVLAIYMAQGRERSAVETVASEKRKGLLIR